MKAVRIFTRYCGNLPGFFEWGGRRVFATVGICTSVPVAMNWMKNVALVQVVIDGRCWEAEVVCTAPADEPDYCLVVYRKAYPVDGNTERSPGPGYVRYVELDKRSDPLTGTARQEAEDRLAAYALSEMARTEPLNRDSAAESAGAGIDPLRRGGEQAPAWRPLVIGI
jgi:hypothetical protein